eukprot:Nk52_evm30s217 gene=Nk52_evmTU30s217
MFTRATQGIVTSFRGAALFGWSANVFTSRGYNRARLRFIPRKLVYRNKVKDFEPAIVFSCIPERFVHQINELPLEKHYIHQYKQEIYSYPTRYFYREAIKYCQVNDYVGFKGKSSERCLAACEGVLTDMVQKQVKFEIIHGYEYAKVLGFHGSLVKTEWDAVFDKLFDEYKIRCDTNMINLAMLGCLKNRKYEGCLHLLQVANDRNVPMDRKNVKFLSMAIALKENLPLDEEEYTDEKLQKIADGFPNKAKMFPLFNEEFGISLNNRECTSLLKHMRDNNAENRMYFTLMEAYKSDLPTEEMLNICLEAFRGKKDLSFEFDQVQELCDVYQERKGVRVDE